MWSNRRTLVLVGSLIWVSFTHVDRAAGQRSLYCGPVLSLTCASSDSEARLLIENVDGGAPYDVWISTSLRDDVTLRLGSGYQRRVVCIAAELAAGRTDARVVIRNATQLRVEDTPAPGHRADVVSACDRSVSPPTLVRHVGPPYTDQAMRARVQGSVTLHGIVEANGRVSDIRVVHSLEESLDAEAQRAFERWQFRAAERMGEAVAVAVTAQFSFKLQP
jgi:TonB family protein